MKLWCHKLTMNDLIVGVFGEWVLIFDILEQIMEMVQRGERPSNIRVSWGILTSLFEVDCFLDYYFMHSSVNLMFQDINDQPPNPHQPIPEPLVAPKPKVSFSSPNPNLSSLVVYKFRTVNTIWLFSANFIIFFSLSTSALGSWSNSEQFKQFYSISRQRWCLELRCPR